MHSYLDEILAAGPINHMSVWRHRLTSTGPAFRREA